MDSQSFRNGYEALEQLFEGYTSEEVGAWMIEHGYWSPMIPSSAAARVRANNNPDKDQYWKLSELLGWSQATGRTVIRDLFSSAIGDTAGSEQSVLDQMAALLQEQERLDARRLEITRQMQQLLQSQGADFQYDGEALGTPESVRVARFQRRD